MLLKEHAGLRTTVTRTEQVAWFAAVDPDQEEPNYLKHSNVILDDLQAFLNRLWPDCGCGSSCGSSAEQFALL